MFETGVFSAGICGCVGVLEGPTLVNLNAESVSTLSGRWSRSSPTTVHQQREALDEEDRQIDGGRPPVADHAIRRNIQNRLVVLEEKLLRGKRLVMGTIVDQLRNI